MIDDVDERLAGEYRGSRERISALATELDDDAAAGPVPACPAWTVGDLVAHVTGLAIDLGAGRRPDGDTQRWVDAQIDDRRGRTLAELVAEWDDGAPAFESMVAERPERWWGLVYDVLVHEHDLRGALGRPGERDGDAVQVATALGLRLVERDLRTHGLPAFRLTVDGETHLVGDGEPELALDTDAFEALRLLGSRRTIGEMRAAPFDGDLDRYLPGLVHMQLPTRPLHE